MRSGSPLASLEHKVASIMASRERFPLFSLASVLCGGSYVYGAGMRLREALYKSGVFSRRQLPCPVVSVGNLAVGGSGKTPLTIHLAKLLQDHGLKVMVVSRGYKGEAEHRGIVVSDGCRILCDARQAGDEPYLMANLLKSVPVIVGRDRWTVARDGLERFKPDIVLLDDGFQHQRLARDLNLVLMDFQAPLGNGHLLPRGSLREPLSALERADAVIFTRSEGEKTRSYLEVIQRLHPRPFFHARHLPVVRRVLAAGETLNTAHLSLSGEPSFNGFEGRLLFAFAGLARNQEFYDTIARMGGRLQGVMGFTDHHRYQPHELDRIAAAAQYNGCNALVTTDKDFVRLPAMPLPMDLIVLGIDIDLGADSMRWHGFIEARAARGGEHS